VYNVSFFLLLLLLSSNQIIRKKKELPSFFSKDYSLIKDFDFCQVTFDVFSPTFAHEFCQGKEAKKGRASERKGGRKKERINNDEKV
jgi:hypothetical protein